MVAVAAPRRAYADVPAAGWRSAQAPRRAMPVASRRQRTPLLVLLVLALTAASLLGYRAWQSHPNTYLPSTTQTFGDAAALEGSVIAASYSPAGIDTPRYTSPAAAHGLPCADQPGPDEITLPALCIHSKTAIMHWAHGALEIPQDSQLVGMWSGDSRAATLAPSDHGRTLLAGHVDDVAGGPGGLARLHEAELGMTIRTADTTGTITEWTINVSQLIEQDQALPLLTATDQRQLVLVTCEGPWIKDHYGWHPQYNRVVIATPKTSAP